MCGFEVALQHGCHDMHTLITNLFVYCLEGVYKELRHTCKIIDLCTGEVQKFEIFFVTGNHLTESDVNRMPVKPTCDGNNPKIRGATDSPIAGLFGLRDTCSNGESPLLDQQAISLYHSLHSHK